MDVRPVSWTNLHPEAGAVNAAQETGPFFHGTTAVLHPRDLLSPGFRSDYRPDVVMNHVSFTALRDGAGLAAELAAELAPDERAPRVSLVDPTGPYEDDPNVTDEKFPGNPTRSYRSTEALTSWRGRPGCSRAPALATGTAGGVGRPPSSAS